MILKARRLSSSDESRAGHRTGVARLLTSSTIYASEVDGRVKCEESDLGWVEILEEETSFWPRPFARRKEVAWLKLDDATLIKLLTSVYAALENDLTVLAAIGMRVVFERASELIGIDPDKSFAKKLEQLHQEGHIGTADKEFLQVLTDAGSAAAHRGWEPDNEQLRVLTSIMEHFVNRLILKDEAGKLKGSIPVREKRRSLGLATQSENLIEFRVLKTPRDS